MFSLAALITSKTRCALIEFFIKNPTLELGMRETARRMDSNVMLTRSELLLLKSCGILKSRKVANSIQYCLDEKSPIVPPLRELVALSGRLFVPGAKAAALTEKNSEVPDDD